MRRTTVIAGRPARFGASLLLVVSACGGGRPPKPDGNRTASEQAPAVETLTRAQLLGRWERWCFSEDRDAPGCLGRDRHESWHEYAEDGTLRSGSQWSSPGPGLKGRWSLEGGVVEHIFEQGSAKYEAWIVDGQLVLWRERRGDGFVYGKAGAKFHAIASPVSTGGAVEGQIGDFRYTLPVPAGYRLRRDLSRVQVWGPERGEGLVWQIRPKLEDDPCEVRAREDGGSEIKVGDAWQQESSDVTLCLEGAPRWRVTCSVEHTRGHLKKGEDTPGLEVCRGLKRG